MITLVALLVTGTAQSLLHPDYGAWHVSLLMHLGLTECIDVVIFHHHVSNSTSTRET